MAKYKLLIVDLDGTLVNRSGDISEKDRHAVANATAAGVKVALSTGRIVRACRRIIDLLSLDGYHIFYDGALVSDPHQNKEVYTKPIDKEVVRRAVEFSRRNDTYLELYSSENFFAERENWSDTIHRRFFKVEPTFVDFSGIWERERIIKAELVVHNEEEAAKAESFRREFDGSLRFSIARAPAYPGIDFVNIIDPDVSKGEALKALVSFIGIPMSRVIAIGDGLNDISLLQVAGTAVAMGNAFPEVKEVADHITLDVEESGVAAVVERFVL
ncbi:MAG TPA: HAD family phosphatase [Dehalococcoidia bacterium]|nr:HAD family phosphatase [Dehalococcoidia bacterium]